MYLKHKIWFYIPASYKEKIKLFGEAVEYIKYRCLYLYEKYSKEGSTKCLKIARNGKPVWILDDSDYAWDYAGVMDLWLPAKMKHEKVSYVWHSFVSIPEDLSLRLAEFTNLCDGGQNNGPIYDGWIFTPGNNTPELLMDTITKLNEFGFGIDLPYVTKPFELPAFMKEIIRLEKSNTAKTKENERLRRIIQAKDQKIAYQVFIFIDSCS